MKEVVRFRCPGCGSELETPEGTVSNRCTYCGLVWILGRPGRVVKRYYRPDIDSREARFVADRYLKGEGRHLFSDVNLVLLFYVPFYRFHGLSLTCLSKQQDAMLIPGESVPVRTRGYELRARNFDVTVPGCSENSFGLASLGIRPQAVATYAYCDSEIPEGAEVVAPDLVPKESQDRAFKINDSNVANIHSDKQAEFAEMVGETQSLIFFPLYVVSGTALGHPLTIFVDGVSKRVFRDLEAPWEPPESKPIAAGITELKPEPHHCPNCGADFEPSERSLYYACDNCDRYYFLRAHGYEQIAEPLVGQGAGRHYPFWRLPLVFTEPRRFDTVGTFARLLTADVPLLAKQKATSPFYVFVPAFAGADAEWQVQTAVRMTRTQPETEIGGARPQDAPPVSLPETECKEFAAFAWNWLRMSYLNLRGERFDYRRAEVGLPELLWLPLQDMRLQRSVTRAGATHSPRARTRG